MPGAYRPRNRLAIRRYGLTHGALALRADGCFSDDPSLSRGHLKDVATDSYQARRDA
jgi:hypothetical protein